MEPSITGTSSLTQGVDAGVTDNNSYIDGTNRVAIPNSPPSTAAELVSRGHCVRKLNEIETEARGFVPDEELTYWLSVQRYCLNWPQANHQVVENYRYPGYRKLLDDSLAKLEKRIHELSTNGFPAFLEEWDAAQKDHCIKTLSALYSRLKNISDEQDSPSYSTLFQWGQPLGMAFSITDLPEWRPNQIRPTEVASIYLADLNEELNREQLHGNPFVYRSPVFLAWIDYKPLSIRHINRLFAIPVLPVGITDTCSRFDGFPRDPFFLFNHDLSNHLTIFSEQTRHVLPGRFGDQNNLAPTYAATFLGTPLSFGERYSAYEVILKHLKWLKAMDKILSQHHLARTCEIIWFFMIHEIGDGESVFDPNEFDALLARAIHYLSDEKFLTTLQVDSAYSGDDSYVDVSVLDIHEAAQVIQAAKEKLLQEGLF